MTILLLDFEKAYDLVNWAFLKANMERMGFLKTWIRGVATMHKSFHSQVLFATCKRLRRALLPLKVYETRLLASAYLVLVRC